MFLLLMLVDLRSSTRGDSMRLTHTWYAWKTIPPNSPASTQAFNDCGLPHTIKGSNVFISALLVLWPFTLLEIVLLLGGGIHERLWTKRFANNPLTQNHCNQDLPKQSMARHLDDIHSKRHASPLTSKSNQMRRLWKTRHPCLGHAEQKQLVFEGHQAARTAAQYQSYS